MTLLSHTVNTSAILTLSYDLPSLLLLLSIPQFHHSQPKSYIDTYFFNSNDLLSPLTICKDQHRQMSRFVSVTCNTGILWPITELIFRLHLCTMTSQSTKFSKYFTAFIDGCLWYRLDE